MELVSRSNLFVSIDEPEAFLHPPQAEMIGNAICELKSDNSQVFVATHDSNVLKGFLSSAHAQNVTVVRVERDGDKNPISVLKSTAR